MYICEHAYICICIHIGIDVYVCIPSGFFTLVQYAFTVEIGKACLSWGHRILSSCEHPTCHLSLSHRMIRVWRAYGFMADNHKGPSTWAFGSSNFRKGFGQAYDQ